MIVGIGIDVIEIERIQKAATDHFIQKYFTEAEREYFKTKKKPAQTIAGHFAAKEAVSKAIGVGFRHFSPIDIEISRNGAGKPYVNVYNNAQKICKEKGIAQIFISISHSKVYAISNAVAEGDEKYESSDSV